MKDITKEIELPKEWHYNIQLLRMERTVEVRDENDELIGYNEHCALVPRDIVDFITSHQKEVGSTNLDDLKNEFEEKFIEQTEENDFFQSWTTRYPSLVWEWFESKLNEVREDSVREFVEHIEEHIFEPFGFISLEQHAQMSRALNRFVEEYLSSIGKDKIWK